MKNSKPDAIPITDFYGESTSFPVTDMLYCEQLQLRSAMYDWQIKAHRHKHFAQFFYVSDGSGVAEVDNQEHRLGAGDLLIVPQQCVHTFLWEEGSNGYVLYIAHPLLTKMSHILGNMPWSNQSGLKLHTDSERSLVETLLATMCLESQVEQSKRELFCENLALSLGIWISRQTEHEAQSERSRTDRSKRHTKAFSDLIEANFTKHHTVEWYAREIGISAAHLNTLSKHYFERPALAMIHQRQLSEAKRSLMYTAKPSSCIAEELGFTDAAYFNRFFKRLTGATPGAFRKS